MFSLLAYESIPQRNEHRHRQVYLTDNPELPPVSSSSGDQTPNAIYTDEPEFIEPIQNVTVALGRDARIPCYVRNLGTYQVIFVVFFCLKFLGRKTSILVSIHQMHIILLIITNRSQCVQVLNKQIKLVKKKIDHLDDVFS